MKLDILFIDSTAYKPYDSMALQLQPLGGTEASVVRIAEALAGYGLAIAVAERNLPSPVLGTNKVLFIPHSMLKECNPDVVVMLRGVSYWGSFPKAKLFSWQHDLPNANLLGMRNRLIASNITTIAVSKWHKHAIQDMLCDRDSVKNPKVKYVYNPVPDKIFVPRSTKVTYQNKTMCWVSSPHKGLDKALSIFDRIVDITGDRELVLKVFNPGYLEMPAQKEAFLNPNIKLMGPMPCLKVWEHVQDSLCVLYPCQYPETFGLVAAEANALHTPVATYELAGLCETVAGKKQTVSVNDEVALIKKVINWYNGDRPEVYGQDRFRTSEVVQQWVQILAK